MTHRRDVLKAGLAGAALMGRPAFAREKAAKPLQSLVLGGTGFLGPHFVEAARAHGHTLTLFNRGKTIRRSSLAPRVWRSSTATAGPTSRRWKASADRMHAGMTGCCSMTGRTTGCRMTPSNPIRYVEA